MKQRFRRLRSFLLDDSGQGMVEYILIIGLIVLFILVALFVFRNAISAFIAKVAGALDSGAGSVKTPTG